MSVYVNFTVTSRKKYVIGSGEIKCKAYQRPLSGHHEGTMLLIERDTLETWVSQIKTRASKLKRSFPEISGFQIMKGIRVAKCIHSQTL